MPWWGVRMASLHRALQGLSWDGGGQGVALVPHFSILPKASSSLTDRIRKIIDYVEFEPSAFFVIARECF